MNFENKSLTQLKIVIFALNFIRKPMEFEKRINMVFNSYKHKK
jgi:hypothetical protein